MQNHSEPTRRLVYAWEGDMEALRAENERLREVVAWVESWVSNPVGSYSVHALDGLFGLTRDKIASLKQPSQDGTKR